MQKSQLPDDQKQKEDSGSPGIQKILQYLQSAQGAQRNKVIFLQGYGVNGSTAVSKTVCPGSSPGTPATFIF
jgi:hypothetical protein